MTESVLIDCRNLAKTYQEGGNRLTVFADISLRIHTGETAAIVGTSGSGKTTLLNMLGGLDKPSAGEVIIAGENMQKMREGNRCRFRNRNLGFVYQFHHLLPEFTALQNVAMPCVLGGMAVKQALSKAEHLLQRVGLAQRISHKPGELSGGERQRVAIARALVNEPRCVLMDEPTGNLDDTTGEQVQELILELCQQLNITFLVVTHDRALAARLGRVYRLDHGGLQLESVSGG
ncbi:MAG: lipoprotein-releasing ABC transporter ATP-binding protein LolD [Halomonadaceae bacterium]|nr:MAG: lipoprotein-releasing ABC transporter ATP-binding protein LolD [Halomonadaceae bacterium]